MSSPTKNIVIIGGGIIGCTTAYYITRHPRYSREHTTVTVLEACSVAGGASGKAGGLIARWAYPNELVKIAFAEHERLARIHGGAERWGFRYIECGQWVGKGTDANAVREEEFGFGTNETETDANETNGRTTPTEKKDKVTVTGQPEDLDWLYEGATESYDPMARTGETGQIHPYYFTKAMLEFAQERGVELVTGKVTEILCSPSDPRSVTGIKYTDSSSVEQTMEATHIIVAAGPWTPTLIPGVPISGTRAHSITIRPTRDVSAYALFTEIALPESLNLGPTASPEIFTRPKQEVYASSTGDGEPLPETTDDVKVNEEVCDLLFKHVSAISPVLAQGELLVKQACYLPNVDSGPRGCPIVGEVDDVKGLIIASGHSCWGISNAPGTGKALAELILDGKITCAKLDRLAPRMFM